jgi:hypothetical protein
MWDFFSYGDKHHKLHVQSLVRSFSTFLHSSPHEQLHQGCLCHQSTTYFWHFMTFLGFFISIAFCYLPKHIISWLTFDLHVRVEEHHTITNLHGCALPMFQWHMSELMFEMFSNFLIVFCPNWKICLFGLSPDGARNLTRCVANIMTWLQDFMHDDYSLFHIWCKAHQLDLVMEHIMNVVVKKCLFLIMIGFITHPIWQ